MSVDAFADSSSMIVPVDLRTEYLVNPLGLDMAQPRLSWILRVPTADVRGARQTGYHIRVSRSVETLTQGSADLWDSGEVASDLTAHIHYDGQTLASRSRCWWTVRVRDQNGRWSAWSAGATWTMGLLSPSDWTAKWIGTGESFQPAPWEPPPDKVAPPDNTLPDPWFRRSFILPTKPVRATAYVASVGYHELFVNARKAGDLVLAPSVTDNSKRARYVSYEIADLLSAGENTLGLWLGTSWSIFSEFATDDKPRAPIALGQFEFEFADGSSMRIPTDERWKTYPSPNTLLGVWYFMNFGGERYDATREQEDWATPGFDDSGCRDAIAFTPKLALSAEKIEPNRLLTELRPIEVTTISEREFRADFGRNFAGWMEIDLSGEPGDEIELLFSERADRPMTHRLRSIYVIGPKGRGTFRHRFNYSSARWVTIRGVRRKPDKTELRGWLVRTDFAPASSFECSQPLLNEIHATTLWTLENLALGGYIVDCPQRERMGYGGDGHASITTALSHYAMGAFCTKWAEDWRDVQGRASSWAHGIPPTQPGGGAREDDNLPYTAPTYWGGGGPAWSGFCVHLPWETYVRYGDVEILRSNFDTIERWLRFLDTKTDDNLLRHWGGEWDFLSDWMAPGKVPHGSGFTRESLFFNNCYWIYNLQTAADIARILGRVEQASAWHRRASEARAAVHREFYSPENHSYVTGSQACLAMALVADVPPSDERSAVVRQLEKEIQAHDGHIHAGITGGAFLFKALMQEGRDDLLFAMVNRTDYPGWGHMLANGATTLWESWSDDYSLLHSSFLYVGAWFIHSVLGIQADPTAAGFRHFILRPSVTDRPELSWAKGHYDSIRGRIHISWTRSTTTFELAAEVPPNSTATLFLPADAEASVLESGRELRDAPGVSVLRLETSRIVLRLEPGRYRFISTLLNSASARQPS